MILISEVLSFDVTDKLHVNSLQPKEIIRKKIVMLWSFLVLLRIFFFT